MNARIGSGAANGTFGELLQGVLPSERNFLVTCPIRLYSFVNFYPADSCDKIEIIPQHKHKVSKLIALIQEYYGLSVRGKFVINSQIVEGKGMASSSADLVATAKAIDSYFKIHLSNKNIEYFLSQIEPSDGVMYPGYVSYYHRESLLRNYLGSLPTLTILAIDQGGMVDTIDFNQRPKYFNTKEKHEYAYLLMQLEAAIRKSDLKLIGQIATRSAILNQRLKTDSLLEALLKIVNQVDCLGVIIAHSGCCIGLLLDTQAYHYKQQMTEAMLLLMQLDYNIKMYTTLS